MRIKMKRGDLFNFFDRDEYKKFSIAHCISRDCAMGKGIAVEFKKRFGGVAELKKQAATAKKTIKNVYNKDFSHLEPTGGTLFTLERADRSICYLITKEYYYQKPTYSSLRESLEDMRDFLVSKSIPGVLMPKIGCGLDRLDWDKVVRIIEETFQSTPIEVIVCTL
ncbi:unnamed protein product, partial [Mesorhabditis belari]|uniref:Macro domain-containing protein n=1 Tax=Mesorhabditis belari TaxID=2138241 RepID=A0AAF3FE02_9BILA